MCENSNFYLPPEFDKKCISNSVKGDILLHGAKKVIKELATNLNCSSNYAAKLILEGKSSVKSIIELTCKDYPLRCYDWKSYKWWMKKKNSTEWTKERKTYLPSGKVISWRWIDRANEIYSSYIHNENESPAVVMNRVFQNEEFWNSLYDPSEDELKEMPDFPDCPLKGNEEFKQVKTPLELYLVGKSFDNCAFSYKDALDKGETYIFTSSEVCAEVCRNNEGKWRIQQCLGYKNAILPEDIKARFQKWFDEAVKKP